MRERWWYKFVQVCQRWRYLVLGSASHLGLCLVCTRGTPVADMLAHSPPFPLIIDHDYESHDLATEDEEGTILALRHRDRVTRVNLRLPVTSLQKLITALDDEFTMLEYLYIAPPLAAKHNALLTLPSTFRAPHLRLLILSFFSSPIGSPLLVSAVNLAALALRFIQPSTYPHPNGLLQPLSLLPNLETLEIGFCSAVPTREIELQLSHTPILNYVTFPNLHWFSYWGVSAYLEALLPHVAAPRLERFRVHFFNQITFPILHLLQFTATMENFRFRGVRLLFYHEGVAMFVNVGTGIEDFFIQVLCRHLDWQVSSMAQVFNILGPLFSNVTGLNLDYRAHTSSSQAHNQVDCVLWRELFKSFRHVKTLRVHHGLVGEVSRFLKLDGEPPPEIFPDLEELICSHGSVDDKTFAAFIHEREAAGHPLKLIRAHSPTDSEHYFFYSSTKRYSIHPEPVARQ